MKIHRFISLTLGISLIAACSTNGSSVNPGVTQANLSANTLQLAVGTANIAADGTVGLNVVATYRQPNGNSAVFADTPTLTGPSGFTVPASAAGLGAYSTDPSAPPNADAGTNHISGSAQVPLNVTPPNTTLGTYTGVFSYGLAPLNSDQTGAAYYPGNPNAAPGNGFESSIYAGFANQPQPYFGSNPQVYIGGPPAYPFFNDGTFPAGFAGYSQGFTAFEVTPVTGTYSLSVAVTPSNAGAVNPQATANLSSVAPLPTLLTPTFTPSGGGGTGSVTVPPDPRIVETMVYIRNRSQGTYFTVGPLTGTGALTFTLPGNLGICSGTGCQNDPTKSTASLGSGDVYRVFAVSFDYPAFEAGPPNNRSPNPTITGASGQADISLSPPLNGTVP